MRDPFDLVGDDATNRVFRAMVLVVEPGIEKDTGDAVTQERELVGTGNGTLSIKIKLEIHTALIGFRQDLKQFRVLVLTQYRQLGDVVSADQVQVEHGNRLIEGNQRMQRVIVSAHQTFLFSSEEDKQDGTFGCDL